MMNSIHPLHMLRSAATALLVLAMVAGCNEEGGLLPAPVGPEIPVEMGIVLGSVDLSLTLFPVDTPTVTRTIGLAAAGTPVGMAVRGSLAAIPLGTVAALAVVDLAQEQVVRTIPLPDGSGASGVDFVSDAEVVVANPALNSVTRVNVTNGTVGPTTPVGTYPQAVLFHEGRVYVANAQLENFAPTGPGTLSVLDPSTMAVVGTVALTGTNPGGIAPGPDGRLYVLHGGTFGGADGSLSIVAPATLQEELHVTGFGEFPGQPTFGPDGTMYAASFSYGISAWAAGTRTFVRGPDQPIQPGGTTSVSGLGVDALGRLYALEGTCTRPSRALRLDGAWSPVQTVTVGVCPTDVAFAQVLR